MFRLKTCFSLFEVHTDSIRSTKLKVDRIVSLWLNMACEFKRAGFLEGEAIETPLPIGLKPSGDLRSDGDARRPSRL